MKTLSQKRKSAFYRYGKKSIRKTRWAIVNNSKNVCYYIGFLFYCVFNFAENFLSKIFIKKWQFKFLFHFLHLNCLSNCSSYSKYGNYIIVSIHLTVSVHFVCFSCKQNQNLTLLWLSVCWKQWGFSWKSLKDKKTRSRMKFLPTT